MEIAIAIVLVLVALGLVLSLTFLPRRMQSLLQTLFEPFRGALESLRTEQGKVIGVVQQELSTNRQESSGQAKQAREELSGSLKAMADSMAVQFGQILKTQQTQLEAIAKQLSANTDAANQNARSNREEISQSLEKMRLAVEARLDALRTENSQKLEQMRATVDEKLHATLEKRLGESFKIVSDRLEKVHAGLGEMQRLASDVGNLKHVLTNIKTRGTWGEVQLGALLEQVLSPEQYEKNVAPKRRSSETVEYAIKLPGRDGKDDVPVWLPIDSKFPQEDYQRLLAAQEQADPLLVEETSKSLEKAIRESAKTISTKYIDPPNTTDFAIMFLPTEGLYAEILRRPGICETLQRDHRVVVTGPTTLGALLNSLQMGFRTLAIEKRSSEVWKLLAAVKTEFGNFGTILEKTQKKLEEATSTIEKAASKSRTIVRKLRKVQEMPSAEAARLLTDAEESETVDVEPDAVATGEDASAVTSDGAGENAAHPEAVQTEESPDDIPF